MSRRNYWSTAEVADAVRILELAVTKDTGTLAAAIALGLANSAAEGLAVRAATDEEHLHEPGHVRRRIAAGRLASGWQPTTV